MLVQSKSSMTQLHFIRFTEEASAYLNILSVIAEEIKSLPADLQRYDFTYMTVFTISQTLKYQRLHEDTCQDPYYYLGGCKPQHLKMTILVMIYRHFSPINSLINQWGCGEFSLQKCTKRRTGLRIYGSTVHRNGPRNVKSHFINYILYQQEQPYL